MINLAVVFIVFSIGDIWCISCPDGWVGHKMSCYHFSHDKEQWSSAVMICKLMGGYLAEINDGVEGNFLSAQVKLNGGLTHDDYWLGAEDFAVQGDWIWVSSNRLLNVTAYTNWRTGEPNNSKQNQNCLALEHGGKWNDEECSKEQKYICESEPSGTSVQILG